VVTSTLENISASRFTEATIRRMYEFVQQAKTDPKFQRLIYAVVNGALPGHWKNYRAELDAILSWAKRSADYRRDPYGVELVQDVWATLDRRRADCDDFAVLVAAAAEVLGSPARFVTVSTLPDGTPSHVYAQAFCGGRWLGLDAIVPGSTVGWEPLNVTARRVWSRSDVGLAGDGGEDFVEGIGMIANTSWYRPETSIRTYRSMGGLGIDFTSILGTVSNIASGIVAGVKTGTVTNVESGINQAIASYTQAQQAALQAQLAAAQTAQQRAAIEAQAAAAKEAQLAEIRAEVARQQAGGMPGWVLPVAAGAGVLVLAAVFARGRR
jgi:hypothetical protein